MNKAEKDDRDAGHGDGVNEEQSDEEVANSSNPESQQLGSEHGVEEQHTKYGTDEDMELGQKNSNVNADVESVGSSKERKLGNESNCEFQETRL